MRFLFALALFSLSMFLNFSAQAESLNLQPGRLGSGKILIPCEFDGFIRQCRLDSGAQFSALAYSSFSAAYTKQTHMSTSGIILDAQDSDMILISKLILDHQVYQNQLILRTSATDFYTDTIGMDVLKNYRVSFQFLARHPEFHILNSQSATPLQADLNMDAAGIASIPITQSVHALWDTGSELTAVDSEYIRLHPNEFSKAEAQVSSADSTGKKIGLPLFKMHELKISGCIFKNLNVLAVDMQPMRPYLGDGDKIQMLLGYNLITQANWTMDFAARKWSVNCPR
jgi:hypothetical protein